MGRRTRFLSTLVVASFLTSAASAQSLGDVAKQEEARRKTIAKPAKVYTNEDLGKVTPEPPATGAPASPADGAPPSTATAPSPSGATGGPPEGATPRPTDEAAWRQRMATARDNLARSQTFRDALQSRINALTTDFANRADPAQRATIGSDRQKALAELDRVSREIDQYQKAITDIQEDARKAGIPAGWVR
jgi:hypothetical protein